MGITDDTLKKSREEKRDQWLRSPQWGDRNTTENWANNAWGFLADFRQSVTRDIADRALSIYHVTGTYQCGRGMSEYSMLWTTPEEQEKFDAAFAEISRYAGNIDDTMDKTGGSNEWTDFGLTLEWTKQREHFPMLPKFRVWTDITAESGTLPPKTGVYVSVDDPHASLQFAWVGSPNGRLVDCTSFNDLGKTALAAVGRSRLWVDEKAMLDFVFANLSNPALSSDPFFKDPLVPKSVPSLVARNAFTSHPSQWCYVELLNGEFEPVEIETEHNSHEQHRFASGTTCHDNGFYFTPAQVDSRRRFERGDVFPDLGSTYGKVIWQWDAKQN